MKPFLLTAFIFILFCFSLHAQQAKKFNFFTGYGFFEGVHAGTSVKLKSGSQRIGLSLGAFDLYDFQKKYYTVSIYHSLPVFLNKSNIYGYPKWHINNALILWQLEDKYYTWRVLSFVPSLGRYLALNKNIGMDINAGMALNLVLYNKRKTFEKAGWPYHIYPNLKISLVF